MVYLDQVQPARHDTTYRSPVLQLSASLNRAQCNLLFFTPTNQDRLGLAIPRTLLPATLRGRYPFRAPIPVGQGAYYRYIAQKPDKAALASRDAWTYDSSWLPSTGAVTGAIEITAYDAQHHLLSGRFELALTGVYDPRAQSRVLISRRCDLTLTGTFTNVPVTEED